MSRFYSETVARKAAIERGEVYGMACFDGWWYVGPYDKVRRIVQYPIDPIAEDLCSNS